VKYTENIGTDTSKQLQTIRDRAPILLSPP
jgi:hypothetical protein